MTDSVPARIVSLLPATTGIVCALGLRDNIVGRSRECDEPADVAGLPTLARTRIDAEATSRGIHEQVGGVLAASGKQPASGSCSAGSSAALFDLDVAALPALRLTTASSRAGRGLRPLRPLARICRGAFVQGMGRLPVLHGRHP